jgi:transposase-like protein
MTFTTQEDGEIIKRDTMGRLRVSRVSREALLDEYERSGRSGVEFAARVGIKYSTLGNWIRERRKRKRLEKASLKGARSEAAQAMANGQWVEAVIEKGVAQRSIQICFVGGASLELDDAQQLGLAAELIRRLGARGC